AIMAELAPRDNGRDIDEYARLFFQVPLTFGLEIRNPLVFAGVLAAAKKSLNDVLPNAIDWEPKKEPYKTVTIVQIKPRPNGLPGVVDEKVAANIALYYALVDGAWYISLREDCIHDLIDQAAARKNAGAAAKKTVEVNTTLFSNPQPTDTRQFLRQYLE